jgi:hypothetical protein
VACCAAAFPANNIAKPTIQKATPNFMHSSFLRAGIILRFLVN